MWGAGQGKGTGFNPLSLTIPHLHQKFHNLYRWEFTERARSQLSVKETCSAVWLRELAESPAGPFLEHLRPRRPHRGGKQRAGAAQRSCRGAGDSSAWAQFPRAEITGSRSRRNGARFKDVSWPRAGDTAVTAARGSLGS